jgi:hypothetical protein
MLRAILGTIAGVVIAFVVIMLLELGGQALFPPPPGLDPRNPDDVAAIIAQMPLGAFLYILACYVAGAAAGGAAGNLIARRRWPALVVGGLIALGSVANAFMIDQPLWVNAAAVVLPLVTGWLVSRAVPKAA